MKETLTVMFYGLWISLLFGSPALLTLKDGWIVWLPIYAGCCLVVFFVRRAKRKAREKKAAIEKH